MSSPGPAARTMLLLLCLHGCLANSQNATVPPPRSTDLPTVCSQRAFSYVLLGGLSGAVARSVVTGDMTAGECPAVKVDGVVVPSTVHAAPSANFPVTVCDADLPASYSTATVCNTSLPIVPANPQRHLLIGDTGYRLKVKDTGIVGGPCNNFSQCLANFDAKKFHVSYQGVGQDLNPDANQWPYKRVASAAATNEPDLVIHVGDYLYKESACPEVCTQGHKGVVCPCQASGPNFGDNWHQWVVEFFEPSAPLLRTAPWITLRGNHETCERNWEGYFKLMWPRPMPDLPCPNYVDSFKVTFQNEVYLVTDTSYVRSPYGPKSKKCPHGKGPVTVEGLWGPSTQQKADAQSDGVEYLEKFKATKVLMDSNKNNIFLSHCPIYAMVCYDNGNGPQYHFFEPILQKALALSGLLEVTNPTTGLQAITMIMSGHMHWFQYHNVANSPDQLVFGHGGTQLLAKPLHEAVMKQATIVGHNLTGAITEASSVRAFGYVVMGRSGGSYSLSARDGNNLEHYLTSVGMSTGATGSGSSSESTRISVVIGIVVFSVFAIVVIVCILAIMIRAKRCVERETPMVPLDEFPGVDGAVPPGEYPGSKPAGSDAIA